jgi:undecaprenyl diphosphate synthase
MTPVRGKDANGASQPAFATVPAHVAIIMDGNGRWANSRGLGRSDGHRAGTENIRRIIRAFARHGVKYLTIYAFSTENWERPTDEVGALMELLGEAIRNETESLHKEGVRIRHLGRVDRLSPYLQRAINESVELTKRNTAINLNVAFDYGGREEVLQAVRAMLRDRVRPDEVDEEALASRLYTAGLPDPDLIIRTAGEMRISNFLLWQAAYAEYYTTPTLWPDFDEAEVEQALAAYAQRQRRFGRVSPAEVR